MLKILKSSDPLTIEQIVACIYGPPGVGKTSLGFTAEAPLLLDFDSGAHRSANRGDSVQVKSWSEVSAITGDDLKPYKTLVMDTAGRALDLLTVDIIAGNPKLGRGGALTLQGYGELKSRFIAYTKLVRSFGLDIVMICHADEQRNGDDVIERLDVQGGSKNEIYKSADIMGRIKVEGGKRVLNFSPTDTAFGKNPASLPKLEVPDFGAGSNFLGQVIADTKAAMNKQTEAQKQAAKELADWQARFDEAKTADEFNKLMPQVAKEASEAVSDNVKRLLVKAAGTKGIGFDKKKKAFQPAQAAA